MRRRSLHFPAQKGRNISAKGAARGSVYAHYTILAVLLLFFCNNADKIFQVSWPRKFFESS